jgi:DNA-directed RNA polymerase specialized sigma24 family protein
MEDSDRELLSGFTHKRCEDSFRALVDRHLPMVFGVASRITRDRTLSEEVAQTTFAKLAQTADSIGPDTVVAGFTTQPETLL